MSDISFKNRTGKKPELLSAIIGADSFVYGLFDSDHTLLECQRFEKVDFGDSDFQENVKTQLYGATTGIKVKVMSSAKPYIHQAAETKEDLKEYFPAFRNKISTEEKFTDQPVFVEYGVSRRHRKFLKAMFGDSFSMVHISTALSNMLYPYSQEGIHALLESEALHLFYAEDSKFKYYNKFECKNEFDFLYFILLILKELNLDPKSTPLYLGGLIDEDSSIYKLIFNYIQNIQWMDSSLMKISDLRFTKKKHYYIDLFATSICES